MSVVADLVESITFESKFFPAFTIERPFADTGAPPNPFIQAMKPKITIRTSLGDNVSAPYGDPGETLWPQVQFAGLLALGVGLIILVALIKR